ncbi:restriction endonuclease RKpn2kI [Mycoplasma wenyonii str. Massachusetts]|uniref:Restriction endonuclease RKpn2kI n=2 Tax=Mycoplasma wenyonii TaxID=65123 RepID=I6ZIJ7_MYCWM|nr:restriction endonuclease RKpn2kI [Mycoplasma wenyonii str. Massachusetts]
MEADYFVDICKIGALKRWEASQEKYAENSYRHFLERTNNQDFPFPKGVRKFFQNDEIFTTNTPSIAQIKYIFKHLPNLPSKFVELLDKFLEKKISIEKEEVRKELIHLFGTYYEFVIEYLDQIRERKIDYRLNNKTRIEFLTTLFLAEREITLESRVVNEVEGVICSPSWHHKEINYRQVLFFCVRANLSMNAFGGAQKRREVLKELSKLAETRLNCCYLITLEGRIPKKFLRACKENNIQLVTTKSIKFVCYSENEEVITFEKFLNICERNNEYWKDYQYSDKERRLLETWFQARIDHYLYFPLPRNLYQKQLWGKLEDDGKCKAIAEIIDGE